MFCTLATCLATACGGGGGGDATPDDGSPSDAWQRTCWAGGGTPQAGVAVVMGTGITSFEPLMDEATVLMHRGFQGGAHFELNARMSGFLTGDPDDSFVPAPHTLFRVYNQDGMLLTPAECTFPKAYRDAGADMGPGWYQLEYGSLVVLDDAYFPTLDGERVRIQVEVQDPTGKYTSAEHWLYVEDLGLGGVDAGVPDAGVDAGVLDAAAP